MTEATEAPPANAPDKGRADLERRRRAAVELRDGAAAWLTGTADVSSALVLETRSARDLRDKVARLAPLRELEPVSMRPSAALVPGSPPRLLTVGSEQPRLWSAAGTEPEVVAWTTPHPIIDVAVAPDGSFALLVLSDVYGLVRLDLGPSPAATPLPPVPGLGPGRWPSAVAIAPDGATALVGVGFAEEDPTLKGLVVPVSPSDGAARGSAQEIRGPVWDIVFGGGLVFVAAGRSVRAMGNAIATNQVDALRYDPARAPDPWSRVAFECGDDPTGADGALLCFGTPGILACSPDGRRLAVGTNGRHIMLVDLTGPVPRLEGYLGDPDMLVGVGGVPSNHPLAHLGGLRGLAFHEGSGALISAGTGDENFEFTGAEIKDWDASRRALRWKSTGHPRMPWRVMIAPDGASALVGMEAPENGGRSAVEVWSLE